MLGKLFGFGCWSSSNAQTTCEHSRRGRRFSTLSRRAESRLPRNASSPPTSLRTNINHSNDEAHRLRRSLPPLSAEGGTGSAPFRCCRRYCQRAPSGCFTLLRPARGIRTYIYTLAFGTGTIHIRSRTCKSTERWLPTSSGEEKVEIEGADPYSSWSERPRS
jgi:hypothetical protein